MKCLETRTAGQGRQTVKCLETRTDSHGLKRRRYLRADGTRVTTVEVPLSALRSVGMVKVHQAAAAWRRGEQQREEARARRARIEELLRDGVKPTAVAHDVGVSDQWVRRVRKAMLKS